MDEDFLKELASLIKPIVQVELEYRLHYNEDGDIYLCSMCNHPDSDRYIVVTREEYDNYFRYRVTNGVLKMIDNNTGLHVKLKLSNCGYATVKSHAGLLLESSETAAVEYWNTND